jgi:hypothetical protein
MPTGNCRFPEHHHSPSAGPVILWLVGPGLGALAITHLRTVAMVLIVIGILAGLGVPVVLLWHAAHQQPYDAALRGQERHDVSYSAEILPPDAGKRAAALEAENAALRRQLETPAVHQHLHLHGVGGEDMAVIARKALQPPERV